MTEAALRDYLRENGYPEHVIRGGGKGLIERWKKFVEEVEEGYRFGLEDYRNDLDLRGVIALMGNGGEVREADERLHAMLTETDQRVWESFSGDPFWDFGYPRNAAGELLSDLRAAGIAAAPG